MNAHRFYLDAYIVCSALFLVMFGFVMVASSSMAVSELQFGHAFHFIIHHGVMLLGGVVCAWLSFRIPLKYWQSVSIICLLIALMLLAVVCVPGIGRVVNGSRRWLSFAGLTFQVSEFAKCAFILFVSDFLVRREAQLYQRMRPLLTLFTLLGVAAILLLLEPDFGALTVIVSIVMSLIFLAGMPWRYFGYLLTGMLSVLGVILISAPYRLARLTSFLDPWQHPFSSGYQLTQSLIAFGRGGINGLGLGNSVQKLSYLPEAHTDFVFAVLGEELGLMGCFGLIVLLIGLVLRGFNVGRVAMRQQQRFHGYMAYGVSIWIGVQSAINMGVNVGLLPTKGLTLPLISYGGSSLLIMGVAIGWLLRVHHENIVWQRHHASYDRSRGSV